MVECDVKDQSLAAEGVKRIEWAGRDMPVLRQIKARFAKELPLKGQRIVACLHVTTETANLMLVLKAGGADLRLCASNPLSTQDDTAAALAVEYGIPTFAIKGEDNETYYKHIDMALGGKQPPTLTVDDGADLVAIVHTKKQALLKSIVAGMEETTTGIIRLRAMAADGALKYPIIAVNDAETKHFFDNRYGTGQSTLDGITRATNLLWAGRTVVVLGYGWCGRGIASRAKGMGSHVIVTEINPVRALEAAMDGYQVMPIQQAAKHGDVFITVTGGMKALDVAHFGVMKDGAVLANSGHFNVEINIPGLADISVGQKDLRPFVREYKQRDGRSINVLAEGRLVNLAAAEGHPASVMDMSFANQALCAEYVAKHGKSLKAEVVVVPPAIDAEVARLKLASLGMQVDTLSKEQQDYIEGWSHGT